MPVIPRLARQLCPNGTAGDGKALAPRLPDRQCVSYGKWTVNMDGLQLALFAFLAGLTFAGLAGSAMES
jgi:hypothetical protein